MTAGNRADDGAQAKPADDDERAKPDQRVAEILAEIREEILSRREEAGREWLTRQDGLDLDIVAQLADLVDLPRMIDGRPVKGLAKRVVNRLIRFYVRRQSQFNSSVARLVRKLIEAGGARRQAEAVAASPEMLARFEELTRLLAGYHAHLDALHRRIAAVEAAARDANSAKEPKNQENHPPMDTNGH
jgi:hypothetical protein